MSSPSQLSHSYEQFRMAKLELFNWGTFSDRHEIPIAKEGFLIVGRSGGGKSTLLDAISTLLVPPTQLTFNAAAREGESHRRDRNLVSYIRGAWAEQKDELGEITTQYLRKSSSWSAVSLQFQSESRVLTLIHLYWLRGKNQQTGDVKRHFMIAEDGFALSELENFEMDVRKLKLEFPELLHFNHNFRSYSEHFCRQLSIESDLALKLLHKTQSTKNLGDLNHFLRVFMLDKPTTFDAAEELIKEFHELDAAHKEVVTARQQVGLLQPALDHDKLRQSLKTQKLEKELTLASMEPFQLEVRNNLLKQAIEELSPQLETLRAEHQRSATELETDEAVLDQLKDQRLLSGGGKLESIEKDLVTEEHERDRRLARRQRLQTTCESLNWEMPDTPQGFATVVSRARSILDHSQKQQSDFDDQRDQLSDKYKQLSQAFSETRREIESLERQSSNINATTLELRSDIVSHLGLAEEDLPFVGELLEVKENEARWQGSIERVLRGFALSLLVPEKHYTAVSRYVNNTYLKRQRLVYFRVPVRVQEDRNRSAINQLPMKLDVKQGAFTAWLRRELDERFNYDCVGSINELKHSKKAVTLEGLVKHGQTRHEKDDRNKIDDQKQWVLGFDNKHKLQMFTSTAQDQGAQLTKLDSQLKEIKESRNEARETQKHCQDIANVEWREVDLAPILDRVSQLKTTLQELRNSNPKLEQLEEKISLQRRVISECKKKLDECALKHGLIQNALDEHTKEKSDTQTALNSYTFDDHQRNELKKRLEASTTATTLQNLQKRCHDLENRIRDEIHQANEDMNNHIHEMERIFDRYIQTWPSDAADLDASFASAPEFFTKLNGLKNDGLPAFEEKFFDLLRDQSNQNLVGLRARLSQAKKDIRERMELVNESLSLAPFNEGTYLKIDVADKYLASVKEFSSKLQNILENVWDQDPEQAELKFNLLRSVVQQLSDPDPEWQRWRTEVLDVRQHVEFIGIELDRLGVEIEVYRGGSGKSGGQRQKLTTTCLAAALRYQLGGSDGGPPTYASVVLDEAFDKADNEYTELAMNIFRNFGFQMIVATPLKSVMTLEPFIGGACFVNIKDRNNSGTLMIEYDSAHEKLSLPDVVNEELAAET